jgi:hypothetical protein
MNTKIKGINLNKSLVYKISGKENQKVPYLYNQIADFIKEEHIPAVFKMKEDIITLSAPTEQKASFIEESLKKLGIKISE